MKTITKLKKRGETLIEVIIAIFVVALGSGAATTLIVSAFQANSFSRDNLIALNLAVEGLEAVRIVRDNNWLKFGYDKEHCWNVSPKMGPGTDCTDAQTRIETGLYTVDLNPKDYSWGLNFIGSDPTLALDLTKQQTAGNEAFRLGFVDMTPTQDTNKNNDLLDDPDLYITNDSIQTLGISNSRASRFYRMIYIKYIDNPSPDLANEVMIESLVQWKERGQTHQVKLSTVLTNYQKE